MPDELPGLMSGGIAEVQMAGRTIRFHGDPEEDYFRRLQEFYLDLPGLEPYVRANVPRDGVCLDIGANIGLTAVLLSLLCPDGHVYAFEAVPRMAALIRATLVENGITNCTVVNLAVGDAPGEVRFFDSGVGSHAITDEHLAPPDTTLIVPVVTLDDYLFDTAKVERVDFVKMDIEGFEPRALAGGPRFLERFRPPVLMEFNSWLLRVAHSFSPLAFAEALRVNFDAMSIERDGTTVPVTDSVAFVHDNVLVHRSVSDLLLRLKPGMNAPSLEAMTETPKEARQRLRAEAAEAEVAALRASTSWRVTRPLRALRTLMKAR
ncbi:FkbM family methyltransferase [Roseomonas marmotae]|uniref:FkbM family methyltransferase n=1 Tax=Roseomonas marmotae TaxID=2768161 RepID=A0ABS3K8D5_9PROT|nr:FkbM family methyltransferase [Roseomonas marmotae]MBO1073732.1 FkbM family methyltransferase [Roseomonas marmotae]QTI78634.1 FkbM family methyltransferase [Roseomonas marmotae]